MMTAFFVGVFAGLLVLALLLGAIVVASMCADERWP
jgi:hypothetical protein